MKTKAFYLLFIGFLLFGMNQNKSIVQAEHIPITENTFPDAYFRQFVLANIDKNRDSILSDWEISKTTKIKITYEELEYGYSGYGRGLSTDVNFQGIEYFTNLQDLEIDADQLSQHSELGDEDCEMALDIQLDLSKNKKIKRFFCRAGSVKGLDLSQHHQLQDIYLYTVWDQNYPVQNLSKHVNLKKVHVGEHVILPKKLPQLTEFEYFGKSKCKFNVNNSKKLKKIICSYSPLPKPNFSRLKNLTYLDCSGNRWGKLNLSKNTKLKELYCNDCKLTLLRLPKNVKLSVLSCKNNKLKKLNLKKVKVRTLFKEGNKKIKVYYK
ncbi:MAG: hypothetical protein HFG34_10180 [Eubacterium sp.]|nr:hypothetical protein [Eubacterium sp.]